MRILMLNNEFPPLGGGTGTVNLEVFKRFSAYPDIAIDLITSAANNRYQKEQFSERIRIYKIPVFKKNIHHAANVELGLYAIQASGLAIRLHWQNHYDFCFAWSALPAGAVALLLERLLRLPYMVRVSGPDIPGFERRYGSIYPLLAPLLKQIWLRAKPVIAKCRQEVEMIQAVAAEQPVVVIPNGVDTDYFRPGPALAESGPLRVVCVARLIERKGQHHLIRAVKQLADEGVAVDVSLVGTGDALASNQSLAQQLGVADRVHFIGYVPREEITRSYTQAQVFVLPSYNEGMSLAALEAMAAGLPLLLTRTGGTDDLVTPGVNGFTFDWADVEKLASHLRTLASDRELVRHMGAASRSRVESYSWKEVTQLYLALFAALTLRKHELVG